MHVSGLAIEKFDIRANLVMNGVTSLLLLLRRLADLDVAQLNIA